MLVVKLDRTLESSIADDITMSKVLSQDTTSWLLFLRNLIGISVGISGMRGAIIDLTISGSYRNLRSFELSIV